MLNSICDVPGILVGHAQDNEGGSGCTVIITEDSATCGVSVAGGGPGTRETDALKVENLVEKINAIYLGGGSAYGLAGASGVMKWCEENKKGLNVGVGIVPIVPGAVLFDLPVADFKCRPNLEMGYQACCNASKKESSNGNIGAGTGATVGKLCGFSRMMKGGIGTASIKIGDIIIGAIVAVNSFGNIIDPSSGKIVAGALSEDGSNFEETSLYIKNLLKNNASNPFSSNTTIGVIATNASLNKAQATKIAQMAHDGFARAINPIHTMFDGDTIFTLSTGNKGADVSAIGSIAADLMSTAILNAVRAAKTAYGITGLSK